jgi:glucosamine kinase
VKHVLGVDGGGTKTTARVLEVGPDGRLCLLASGHGGGSNPLSVGWHASEAAVTDAITTATEAAGVSIDAAVIAVAGCGSPAAKERLEAWAVSQAFASRTKVVPDTEPLLADVPAGEAAIGLIAGTGSAALVRRLDGSTELVGGWGYLIDDAGSGYTIGRDALRHVAHRWDHGMPADALTNAILQHAGVAEPLLLKGALYGGPDPRGWAAKLARVVLGKARPSRARSCRAWRACRRKDRNRQRRSADTTRKLRRLTG